MNGQGNPAPGEYPVDPMMPPMTVSEFNRAVRCVVADAVRCMPRGGGGRRRGGGSGNGSATSDNVTITDPLSNANGINTLTELAAFAVSISPEVENCPPCASPRVVTQRDGAGRITEITWGSPVERTRTVAYLAGGQTDTITDVWDGTDIAGDPITYTQVETFNYDVAGNFTDSTTVLTTS